MKVLVTGGAGFIGSAVCRHLIDKTTASVINVDKLTYAANLASLSAIATDPRYQFHQVDICDSVRFSAILTSQRPDAILHLAAESHVDRSITGPANFISTNIVGTYTVLEEARKYWETLKSSEKDHFRIVHVSTDEVYGSLGADGAFTESTPYDPSSPYSASKAAADHLASAWHRTYGLPVIVSNCSNNYGPYHFPEKLVPLIITNAILGRELPVYGVGSNIRDWLYVDDHARALDIIVEKGEPGETYNVGGRNERKNIDVVLRICAVLDELRPTGKPRADLIEYVTDRPGHDARYAIDATKLENELGWKAQENFDSGIEKTVRWYLDNEWWWRPLRDQYDGQRLGLEKAKA